MKHTKYLFPLIFCLFLTACGPKPAAVSEPGPDVSAPDVSEPDTSVPESPASLTQEDKAAAYDAAMDYYAGTVFDVHSLTQIDALEGESCSRCPVPRAARSCLTGPSPWSGRMAIGS